MLTDRQIQESSSEYFDAMRYLGATRVGGMVVYATVPISLSSGHDRVLNRAGYAIRFTYDKNSPKLAIDDLDQIRFHTEYCIRWQNFRFEARTKDLVITGSSVLAPQGYELRLHLLGLTVSHDP